MLFLPAGHTGPVPKPASFCSPFTLDASNESGKPGNEARLGTHRFSLRSKPTFAVGFPEVSKPYNEYMSLVIVLVLL